ncbi:methylase [Salinisphaera sp. C84B14]|uniref:class I SAM-dependent methyltransferase n=1 Tax=Salinisphaera sp. C84B14 TaxID=1304155 RepID=UPI00334169D2
MSSAASRRGEAGDGWNAHAYARDARFVAELAMPVVELLDARPGERILDLGCGDGVLSQAIAARGADVLGVDASAELAAAARARGIETIVLDGHELADSSQIRGRFDAVFSNAALHWMKRDPQAVVDAVYQRLLPGGRFVGEFGAAGNVAPIHDALRREAQARGLDADTIDPWYFPTEAQYRERLEQAGFVVEALFSFERPTVLPSDIGRWVTTLAGPFVGAFAPGAARDDYVAAVRDRLIDTLRDAQGRWTAPYVRLRFDARRAAA